MKFNAKEDLKRLFVVCLASVIMALNIKSFVRTGGLYPGGATDVYKRQELQFRKIY